MVEIVQLKKNPPVSDISAWLRKIADDYEAGTHYQGATYMMVIVPATEEDEWPELLGLGIDPGDVVRTGIIAQVMQWLTINKVSRLKP